MRGEDIRKFREKRNYSQRALGDILNEALAPKRFSQSQISEMEAGKIPTPDSVDAFLDALALQTEPEPSLPTQSPSPSEPGTEVPGDSAPAPPFQKQLPISTTGIYTKACTELWEIIGTGIGLMGAITGNDALMIDGQIIDADKEVLGAAYGKLAETNETFRKVLIGMTTGGAWVEVSLVTGQTVAKMYQNHMAIKYPPIPGQDGDGTASADRAFSEPAA